MRTKVEERIPFPWAVKEPLLKETGGVCAHCGTPLDRYTNLSVDHFIPLGKGGSNDPENLTVLCDDCNQLKSDMILSPVSWYPHLSKAKRRLLQHNLQRYMTETDYLSTDCLVPMDSFRIEVPVTTKRNMGYKGIKQITIPVYITGTRMEREDAFAWLMEYKRHLKYREAVGVVSGPWGFDAPCYLLKKGDIDVAMCNPRIIHKWEEDGKFWLNEISIDWFFAPGMPDKEYIPMMLAYLVQDFENYIGQSMAFHMEGASMVLFRIRCFVSDRFCGPVFDILSAGREDHIAEYDNGKPLTTRIRDMGVIHIIGEKKACQELAARMKADNPERLVSMEDAMKANDSLNKRLNGKGK